MSGSWNRRSADAGDRPAPKPPRPISLSPAWPGTDPTNLLSLRTGSSSSVRRSCWFTDSRTAPTRSGVGTGLTAGKDASQQLLQTDPEIGGTNSFRRQNVDRRGLRSWVAVEHERGQQVLHEVMGPQDFPSEARIAQLPLHVAMPEPDNGPGVVRGAEPCRRDCAGSGSPDPLGASARRDCCKCCFSGLEP